MSVANTSGIASFPVPIGTIFFYAGVGVPDTYLDCQGELFDVDRYPLLAEVLQSNTTPALQGEVIGGGPLAQVGDLQGANAGSISSASFTLTSANIPTLANISLTTLSASTSADAWQNATAVGFTDLGNLPTFAPTFVDSTLPEIATWTGKTPAIVSESGGVAVTPTITGGNTTPNTLCLRYIIKAKY